MPRQVKLLPYQRWILNLRRKKQRVVIWKGRSSCRVVVKKVLSKHT